MIFAWCICLRCALSLADDNTFLVLRVTTFAQVGICLDRSLSLAACSDFPEQPTACTALIFDILIVPCRTHLEQLDCWQLLASCAHRELCGEQCCLDAFWLQYLACLHGTFCHHAMMTMNL